MTFLEFLDNKKINTNTSTKTSEDVERLSNLGAISFGPGISDKKITRTPHYEIRKGIEMYELNTIVNSSINQLVSFVIPNKKIKISSKDKATVEYLEEWHEQRQNIIREFKNILITRLACDNAYMETIRYEEDGVKVLDNIFSYNDSTRMYVNPDVKPDGSDAFILELPVGIKKFTYRGKEKNPTYHVVRYIKNYQYTFERVYGILVSSDEMVQYSSGWSRDNIYGRSQLMSAIDADNIFKELISTWDTIIKTRRKDLKIYSVADAETGKRYSQKQLDALTDSLQDTSSSFKLINIPLKLNETEIRNVGTYDLFENIFDIVRRMIMMSLLPQHLTPWNDSATTQGSESAMPPFLLRIKALQQEFIHFLNINIINEIRKSEDWLAKDASYVFDEPIIMGPDYYVRMVTDLVSNDFIKPEQGKRYLMKLGIIDEDILEDNEIATVDGKNDNEEKTGLISFEDFLKRNKLIKESI